MSTALLVMAGVCGYLLIGGIVAAVAARFAEDIEDDGALRGVVAAFWPLALVVFIAVAVAMAVMSAATRIGERIVSRGEDVLDRDDAAEREAAIHGKLPRATARRK